MDLASTRSSPQLCSIRVDSSLESKQVTPASCRGVGHQDQRPHPSGVRRPDKCLEVAVRHVFVLDTIDGLTPDAGGFKHSWMDPTIFEVECYF